MRNKQAFKHNARSYHTRKSSFFRFISKQKVQDIRSIWICVFYFLVIMVLTIGEGMSRGDEGLYVRTKMVIDEFILFHKLNKKN